MGLTVGLTLGALVGLFIGRFCSVAKGKRKVSERHENKDSNLCAHLIASRGSPHQSAPSSALRTGDHWARRSGCSWAGSLVAKGKSKMI